MERRIYLDNSATTRICAVALEKYNETSLDNFGNPSSLHTLGFLAEKELKAARAAICDSLGERGASVIFTASGSEANNLAILGRAYSKDRYRHGAKIITTKGEHASVSEPMKKLEKEGFKIAYLPTKDGVVSLDALRAELTADTVLVSVMMVNNETGALYDIKSISRIVKERAKDALVHVDATQSYLKMPISMRTLGADMITVSSHKIEGPKGVGALVIGASVLKLRGISPVIFGGGQEGGLRSGTENVPAIAAFGAAVTEGVKNLGENTKKLSELREYLVEKLTRTPALSEISPTLPQMHAPHILNVTLPNIKSETMLHYLSSLGIFVSSGSACSSNTGHLSSALTAYGRSEREADCSIRISFAPYNCKEDVDALCEALEGGISKLARIR